MLTMPILAGAETGFSRLGLVADVPGAWTVEAPSSDMRLTQYAADRVAIIVFYFGPGQGGPVEANVARWAGQFRPVDGNPPAPVRSELATDGGFHVHRVEISGDYARGVGSGPIGEYAPDQKLLVAIVETPHGNLFIQAHGDRSAVDREDPAFTGFVQSIRSKSD